MPGEPRSTVVPHPLVLLSTWSCSSVSRTSSAAWAGRCFVERRRRTAFPWSDHAGDRRGPAHVRLRPPQVEASGFLAPWLQGRPRPGPRLRVQGRGWLSGSRKDTTPGAAAAMGRAACQVPITRSPRHLSSFCTGRTGVTPGSDERRHPIPSRPWWRHSSLRSPKDAAPLWVTACTGRRRRRGFGGAPHPHGPRPTVRATVGFVFSSHALRTGWAHLPTALPAGPAAPAVPGISTSSEPTAACPPEIRGVFPSFGAVAALWPRGRRGGPREGSAHTSSGGCRLPPVWGSGPATRTAGFRPADLVVSRPVGLACPYLLQKTPAVKARCASGSVPPSG